MLPREHRLTGKRDVTRVYQRGLRRAGAYLLLRTLPSRDQKSRVAVVVSTAVSKKATERNRAKRVLRALLAKKELPAADMVVTVKRLPQEGSWSQTFQKDLATWFRS